MAEGIDGNATFQGGVNQSVPPDEIGDNQLAGAVNTTLIDGPRPRLKFNSLPIEVLSEGFVVANNGYKKSYADIFATGKFQGMWQFSNSPTPMLLAMVSSILFRIDINNNTATVIFDPNIRFDEKRDIYNATQGSDYFYIHNAPSKTVIIDQDNRMRYANANNTFVVSGNTVVAPEVPISILGTYDGLRLFIARDWNEFLASDPNATGFPQKESTFSEVFAPSAPRFNQSFSVLNAPVSEDITFMGSIVAADTSTGIGGMIIATSNKIEAIQSQNLPSNDVLIPQFGTLIVLDHGIAGPKAATPVGFDFIYMSSRGDLRNLNTSRNQQGQWASPSLSEEVREYFKTNNGQLNRLASTAYFDERIYATVDPYYVVAQDNKGNPIFDYAFRSLAVLESGVIKSMAGAAPPVWAGIWNQEFLGFRDVVRVGNRLFVWCKTTKSNVLCEIKEGKTDFLFGQEYKVTSRLYTKAIGRGQPLTDKFLQNISGELRSFDIKLGLKVTTYFKPFHAPHFYKLNTIKMSVTDCLKCAYNTAASGLKQFVIGAGNVLDKACDSATKRGYSRWKKGQIMIELSGDWRLSTLYGNFIEEGPSPVAEVGCDVVADKLNDIDCEWVPDNNLTAEIADGSC